VCQVHCYVVLKDVLDACGAVRTRDKRVMPEVSLVLEIDNNLENVSD
jgi:hypothetical protein